MARLRNWPSSKGQRIHWAMCLFKLAKVHSVNVIRGPFVSQIIYMPTTWTPTFFQLLPLHFAQHKLHLPKSPNSFPLFRCNHSLAYSLFTWQLETVRTCSSLSNETNKFGTKHQCLPRSIKVQVNCGQLINQKTYKWQFVNVQSVELVNPFVITFLGSKRSSV